MVWDLLRTKKEKPAAGKTGYWRTFWRRRWDSNPRTLADQTISSRSRYDHFDTSPYLSQHQHLRKRGELMGRTKKNIQLKIPEKPRKIKGFRSESYRIATTISSHLLPCCRMWPWRQAEPSPGMPASPALRLDYPLPLAHLIIAHFCALFNADGSQDHP